MTELALNTLASGLFAPHLGSNFSLESETAETLTVTLSSCVENPRGTMRGSARTAFSLLFHRPADGAPPNGGFFTVSHPALGRIGPVYIERVHPASAGWATAAFELVFN